MGFLRLARGEFRLALEAYNAGLRPLENVRMLPEDFHNRGRLRRIFGDYKHALEDHERAIAFAPKAPMPYRLLQLHEDLTAVLDELRPQLMVVEQLFSHYKHVRTSILMGHARGVVLLCGDLGDVDAPREPW